MALPSGRPMMREHRAIWLIPLVSVLSLQSSLLDSAGFGPEVGYPARRRAGQRSMSTC